jgi:branched-chain amino acid transport system substrate-binding protein
MPRIFPRLAALVAVAALAACGGGATGTPTPAPTPIDTPEPQIVIAAGQPVTIGVSAALTGEQSALGNDIADAAELAVIDAGRTFKGHALQVSRKDDGCADAEKAAGVAHAFVKDRILAGVIGPMCTTGAQAANGIYAQGQVVHISPSATRIDLASPGDHFFFRTAWRDDFQSRVQAAYAVNGLRATTAIVVDDAQPYGKALGDAFVEAFEGLGGYVSSRERVDRGQADFGALARQVKSVAPDVLVFEGLNPEGVLLAKALHDAGYAGAFMAPDGVLSQRDFVVAGGPAAEGALITGGANPDEAFVTRFRDNFKRAPGTTFVLQAHDAVSVLLAALSTAATQQADGSLVIDRAKLADTLRAQTFAGLTGPIRFGDDGDRTGDRPSALGLTIYRVTDGQFQPLP